MHYLFILILLLVIFFGPQLWFRFTMGRYSHERNDIRGTGAELARHLITQFELHGVIVEETDQGDHYNPDKRVIGLSKETYHKKSIAAVAVAAHEFGHAMQHHLNEPGLRWRTQLAKFAYYAEKFGATIMILIPIVAAITRVPAAAGFQFASGFAALASSAIVHLVTLPVEWDASFNKAYPILVTGGYVEQRDQKAVKNILRAAALTYVAASLASLLNIWRWYRILRK